ncbi:hypothetical protein [Pedobacter nutrimenti]|uniref:hypothetical protein n=1 Tax=Pedobacter nutrimenti TaxID=1241337 RepID=UPI00292ED3D1|nr:hypothetical protein [Pedobacter nutrimenti]
MQKKQSKKVELKKIKILSMGQGQSLKIKGGDTGVGCSPAGTALCTIAPRC